MSDAPEVMRLFVAVSLPESVEQAIAEFQSELKSALRRADIRWTRPEQFHLTLKFLGNVLSANVAELQERLRTECGGFSALELRAARIGFFPSSRSPRVLWVGISDSSKQLGKVHGAVENAAAGFTSEEKEDRFSAHLTLGRVKTISRRDAELLAGLAAKNAERSFGNWTADSIDLMRSELSSQGARHSCLTSIPLSS